MDFSDQTYALVYSILQKEFNIVRIEELIDWNEETFDEFRDGERIECTIEDEDGMYRVVVLQTAAGEDLLKETKAFCNWSKQKRMTIGKIRRGFYPIRGSKRQSLPSTNSLISRPQSMSMEPKVGRVHALKDMNSADLCPPTSRSPNTNEVVKSNVRVIRVSTPLNERTANTRQLLTVPPSQTPNPKVTAKPDEHDTVTGESSNVPSCPSVKTEERHAGSLPQVLTQASLSVLTYRKVCELSQELLELKAVIERDRQLPVTSLAGSMLKPIKDENDYLEFVTSINDPKFLDNVVHQLIFVGGGDLRDTVRRMVSRLLSIDMQKKFNRTGTYGKLSFVKHLEPIVKRAVAVMEIPSASDYAVEDGVRRALKDASDKEGGRKRRQPEERLKRKHPDWS